MVSNSNEIKKYSNCLLSLIKLLFEIIWWIWKESVYIVNWIIYSVIYYLTISSFSSDLYNKNSLFLTSEKSEIGPVSRNFYIRVDA